MVARLEAEPEEAVSYARERALLEPADEEAQATLVRLLGAAGRRHEAEAHHRSAERRLEELGAIRTGALRRASAGVPARDGNRAVSLALAVARASGRTRPERVSHLILLGTYAQGWGKRDVASEVARGDATLTLMRIGWTQDNPAYRRIFATRFMPDAGPEQFEWFDDMQRVTSTAENAVRLQRAIGDTDIVALLPQVRTPTLVMHLRDDCSVPFEQGRLITSRIPDARFVVLEGRNHIILPHEPAWPHFVAELRGFLRSTPHPR